MSDACSNCAAKSPGCSAGCPSEQQKPMALQASNVRKVIAVMSGKGGVGKSTVTGGLAAAMAQKGLKVGVLDADITGPSIPKMFGLKGIRVKSDALGMAPPSSKSGIKVMSINFFLASEDDPVVWRGPILAGVVKQFWEEVVWGELDFLLVDLPPGTGDVPLTVMQTLPLDGIIIVSSPQELVTMVVKKAVKMAKKMDKKIFGVVENFSYAICPHCSEKFELFGSGTGNKTAADLDLPLLGRLPIDRELNRLADTGAIEEYQSQEFLELADRIEAKLK